VLASQFISNVPAAVLLSGFTNQYTGLMVGTNIGGLGTLIASMASLISFRFYSYTAECNRKKYIGVFTLVNFIFLVILMVAAYWFR
jgi:Na+/H+ antiporter NhaD/arsenite permease-like protein